jgi:hypothetical protein
MVMVLISIVLRGEPNRHCQRNEQRDCRAHQESAFHKSLLEELRAECATVFWQENPLQLLDAEFVSMARERITSEYCLRGDAVRAGRASATGAPWESTDQLAESRGKVASTLRNVDNGGSAETAGNYPLETLVSQEGFVAG